MEVRVATEHDVDGIPRDAYGHFRRRSVVEWAFPGQGLDSLWHLLADNLAEIDSEAMPAYLESSNPENDPRYERLGFVRVGEFERPDGRLTCSTMWREPR
jgi:hypothetical protein